MTIMAAEVPWHLIKLVCVLFGLAVLACAVGAKGESDDS